jgi:protein-S-isoprenylcysteine O-methyltransferase Ste14
VESQIPKLALVAYVAFVLVAFGWRTWRQYRETGDSGLRGLSGGALGRSGSVLLVTGLILAPLAAILELIGWAEPLAIFRRLAIHAMGVAAFSLGFGFTLVAQLQMGTSWRIGVSPAERTALVTHGVFNLVRNPIFAGMLLALLGLVFLFPHVLTALAAACTFVGLELHVRFVEEPHLLSIHGEKPL